METGKYLKGDLVIIKGRSCVLDEFDTGIWWAITDADHASGNDGGESIEFRNGTEDYHLSVGLPSFSHAWWCR